MKNRMLEIGTSGTVRGEDGNILTYSALRLEWQGQDGQKETEQPDHFASLSDFTTSSTRIRFSVHTGTRAGSCTCAPLLTSLHASGLGFGIGNRQCRSGCRRAAGGSFPEKRKGPSPMVKTPRRVVNAYADAIPKYPY